MTPETLTKLKAMVASNPKRAQYCLTPKNGDLADVYYQRGVIDKYAQLLPIITALIQVIEKQGEGLKDIAKHNPLDSEWPQVKAQDALTETDRLLAELVGEGEK